MNKHTPGPWKAGQYLGSLRQFVIHMDVGDKGQGSDVAFTSITFGSDETIANARLIAAAPELLEALQAMLEVHGVTQAYAEKHIEIPQSWVDVSDLARAAIAKATDVPEAKP